MPVFRRNMFGKQLVSDFGIKAFEPGKSFENLNDEFDHWVGLGLSSYHLKFELSKQLLYLNNIISRSMPEFLQTIPIPS